MLSYTPPPSLEGFFVSDKFINLVVGPYGSTKTTAGLIKIAYEAKRIAPCRDGVRRSRAVWIRNTNEQLRDTSIPDFLKWFPDGRAGVYAKTDKKFLLKFDDVECDVMFRGLDDANDVRRLLSLQLTFGVMDEFREINKDIFEALSGRVGRYPDKSMNGVGCKDDDGKQIDKLWGMTNPPDYGTFWEEYLSDPPENAAVFFQPSGVSPEADWLHYLKDGYYENMMLGKSQDWIDVYIHAKFGKSLAGQPVFRCFDRDTHVAKEPIKPLPTDVLIGLDAGLNPSAVVTQQTYDGRVLVLDAITGLEGGMGALRFCREMLKPLVAQKYPTHRIRCVIDPAASQRAQTDERSVMDIFTQEGFLVRPASTNSIAARLGSGESYMTRTINGNPAFLVDPGCKLLIQGLAGKYRYKTNTKGETDDKPEKSHPFSDLCFVAGTMVLTPSGEVAVEDLRPGDTVCVPDGTDVVEAIGDRTADSTVEVVASDGTKLICTPDHPFAHPNGGFVPADVLQYGDLLVSVKDGIWAHGQNLTHASASRSAFALYVAKTLRRPSGVLTKARERFARASAALWQNAESVWKLTACGSASVARTSIFGTRPQTEGACLSTSTSGRSLTAQPQRGWKSTMWMATPPTTTSKIWSVLTKLSTLACTFSSGWPMGRWTRKLLSRKPKKPQKHGTLHRRVESGTESTLWRRLKLGFAKWRRSAARCVEKTTFENTARVTGSISATTVALHVCSVSVGSSRKVYNLRTRRTHVYYANKILVHNCDALTYSTLQHDKGNIFGKMTTQARPVERVPMGAWT